MFIDVIGNDTVTTGEKKLMVMCTSAIDSKNLICINFIDIPVVTTPAPSCDDFDLRLVNTSFVLVDSNPAITGNVEACLGGSYISICDVGWDDVEAQLFCYALGYSEPFFRKFVLQGHP